MRRVILIMMVLMVALSVGVFADDEKTEETDDVAQIMEAYDKMTRFIKVMKGHNAYMWSTWSMDRKVAFTIGFFTGMDQGITHTSDVDRTEIQRMYMIEMFKMIQRVDRMCENWGESKLKSVPLHRVLPVAMNEVRSGN